MCTLEEGGLKISNLATHILALGLGFALGIYALPILTAPASPTEEQVGLVSSEALYTAEFQRALKGSDFFHWGEGEVSITQDAVALMGEVAPGPDYRLYLAPAFVEDEAGFLAVKSRSLEIGLVRTFDNFVVPIEKPVDFDAYNTLVIWCETFGEFISAARYR